MTVHSMNIRVYYEDTDAGGVVYHANYMKFAERARTELLRSIGFENTSLRQERGIIFVVRHIAADYIKTSHLDDMLRIDTSIIQLKNASFVMKHTAARDGDMLFSMDVTLVCVNEKDYRPVPLPTDVRQKFETFLIKHD